MITMIQDDTVKLLKECNAGIKMGVTTIEEVLDKVESKKFKQLLSECVQQHQSLGSETHRLLNQYHDSGKEPNPMAKGMSWLKTNVKLSFDRNDQSIANLVTDGCYMGVKSLSRYLNQYEAAEEQAKNIAKKLIALEQDLTENIRQFL